jgi:predicted secreted Zn-dependent protease
MPLTSTICFQLCRLALTVLGLLIVTTFAASAQNNITLRTNYYPVVGATFREVRQSMNAARPGGRAARTDAVTTWTIERHSKVESVSGECRLTSFRTETRIAITLPLWRRPTNAIPEVRSAWSNYFVALRQHEQGHVDRALAAAAKLHAHIPTLSPDSDCDRLRLRIKVAADRIIAEHRQQEQDYDRQTEHGRKDGARFP